MKFGDQVLFTESGKEFTATVLSARILDHHMGSNDEPLLSLGFFSEVPGVLGTARQNELVQFRSDVAHETHEFSPDMASKGLKGIYPGGRWSEIVTAPPALVATDAGEVIEAPAKELSEGNKAEAEPAADDDASKTDEPKPTLQ